MQGAQSLCYNRYYEGGSFLDQRKTGSLVQGNAGQLIPLNFGSCSVRLLAPFANQTQLRRRPLMRRL